MGKFRCLSPRWEGPAIIYISHEQFGNAGERILNGLARQVENPFTFYELLVEDWDKELTPWTTDFSMGNRVFQGQAAELLLELRDQFVPEIQKQLPDSPIYIAGYSLAGLFALWSLYESDLFDGGACCSASVWYPGWKEYVSGHRMNRKSIVYLSLGKKEKNVKNPVMKQVEENMILQEQLLQQDEMVAATKLVWQEGGHFQNTDERMIQGIEWLLTKTRGAVC